MRSLYTNICNNPQFSLWPWGTSGFAGVASTVNYGKSAARWAFQKTAAGGDTVTISKGTNSTTTKYNKWLRGEPNMTIDISALAVNSTMKVRQFIDDGQDFGQNLVAVTLIASGPAGESFFFGVGENYDTLETLGDDSAGDPILVTKTTFFAFDDPVFTYMLVTPFESPSNIGTYRLHYIQAEVLMDSEKISDLEIRTDAQEWNIISRYITPIKQGMFATGATGTTVRIPVTAPPGGWRVTPSVPTEGRAASVNVILNTTGATVANAAPTFAVSVNPTANNYGAVITLGGFTAAAITAGDQYVIGTETDPICYLDADYF